MGLVYPHATLTPSKRDLMDGWLPTRAWFDGNPGRKPVGSFRFDDPAGEVGMEGFLLGAEGRSTYFLPLTYRATELPGAERHLIGTSEHSELGVRWVYDGCGDPVFVTALVAAILTGAGGVDHEFEGEHGPETRPTNARVRGTGTPGTDVPAVDAVACADEGPLTIVGAGPLELVVARVVGTSVDAAPQLEVTWKGGDDLPIAGVRPV